MIREMKILLEVAGIVFSRFGVDLSLFAPNITAEQNYGYGLYLKNPYFYLEEANNMAIKISKNIPYKFRYLIKVTKSVKGGYTIFLSINLIWDMIILTFPFVTNFVVKDKRKIKSENYIYYSKIVSGKFDFNKQGLIFKSYGWVCTSKENEVSFGKLPIELQTLIWSMSKTGCFYLNVKFDVEPSIFREMSPPSPQKVGMIMCNYMPVTPVPWRLIV